VGPGGTSDTRLTGLEQAPDEGDGFSRATGLALMRALAPEGNAFHRAARSRAYAYFPALTQTIYGTAEAEAVPFVRQSLPKHLRVGEGFMCCRNRTTEKI
jgi:hypothetical protein